MRSCRAFYKSGGILEQEILGFSIESLAPFYNYTALFFVFVALADKELSVFYKARNWFKTKEQTRSAKKPLQFAP